MTSVLRFLGLGLLGLVLLALPAAQAQGLGPQAAAGTAFTYQGFLTDGGAPANGTYDFQFSLYDDAAGGVQVGATLSLGDVMVSDGRFTVQLDFGDVFDGTALWLEVAVRPGASAGPYTALSPRQALTPAPYALGLRPRAQIHDPQASGTTPALQVATDSTSSYAVALQGEVTASAPGGYSAAVRGINRGTGGLGIGVWGSQAGSGWGVYGETAGGLGVYGYASATSGNAIGVYGGSNSTSGTGVYGYAPATVGVTYGVYGRGNSTSGAGVYGRAPVTGTAGVATATSGFTYGVFGKSDSTSGSGVYGIATATSGTTYGVYGFSKSPDGRGVVGYAPGTFGRGVYGLAAYGVGVYGLTLATSGITYGVYGFSKSPNGYGVYGINYVGGYAGFFSGDVYITGDFSVGGTKAFKIDHPLDPANRYLLHFAQEAPQVQNVYNGVVTLDEQGRARVELPPYFSALNAGPFRYQLTPIGAAMPNLHVAQEIQDNVFLIAGGVPGKKVSWEVTAVRNDPYLRDHPVQDQVLKPAEERGTYLYPEGYGQPASKGLDARHRLPEERPAPADR